MEIYPGTVSNAGVSFGTGVARLRNRAYEQAQYERGRKRRVAEQVARKTEAESDLLSDTAEVVGALAGMTGALGGQVEALARAVEALAQQNAARRNEIEQLINVVNSLAAQPAAPPTPPDGWRAR